MALIDMKTMRYINILDRESRIKTTKCFVYNDTVVFAVPRALVSKAIGQDARNIRNMQNMIGKRVKIISEPSSENDMSNFVEQLVSPVQFKSLEVSDGVIVITSGSMQNKASLMGRNKKRMEELETILKGMFGKSLRIM